MTPTGPGTSGPSLRRALAFAAALALTAVGGTASGGDAVPTEVELDFRLPCGLHVHLRPNAKSTRVALVTCHGVGEADDPSSECGLSHLCEHLVATAGIGTRGSRPIEVLAKEYPDGWNAQTARTTTIFGFVVPPGRLDDEIAETAGRMLRLAPTQEDLDREIPRVVAELRAMHEGPPALAAINHARARRAEGADCPRRGGDPSRVARMTLEAVQSHLGRYRPNIETHLAIAGAFDAAKTRAGVEAAFASAPARDGDSHSWSVRFDDPPPGDRWKTVVVAGATPYIGLSAAGGFGNPRDPLPLAGTLIAMARLFERAGDLGPAGTFPPPVTWAPLDGSSDVAFAVPLKAAEDADAAFARVRAVVGRALASEVTAADVARAERTFGLLFSLVDDPPGAAENPYGVALSAARLAQEWVDVSALRMALRNVKKKDLPGIVRDHPYFSGGIHIVPTSPK